MTQPTTADLRDTPYRLIGRLSPTEIELAYGDSEHERWRLATLPNVTNSRYVIRVEGVGYRFAGRLKNPSVVTEALG